ncbi:hypothetical protein [Corynebacterium aquilae]|uniref:Immunity-specific protein n=1 Tax=Corynebacterium aquilae DSM 44791 TaxID=1431546 RepID=A0A1L7CHM9_9CORY|nr:hypothetical protein [Corynebacterium aquilae]APT85315.1 hypothetical protein CAQU_09830 [Corynebacterium aquilae DSM 44791]
MDWKGYRTGVRIFAAGFGQFVGILNEDGSPVCQLPPPISVKAEKTRHGIGTLEATFPARGRIAPTSAGVMELISSTFGNLDEEGRVPIEKAPARLLVIERARTRYAFIINRIEADTGLEAPTTITVKGLDLADYLAAWPAASVPVSWLANTLESRDGDAAGKWGGVRFDMAAIELATTADGYTMTGPAQRVIRKLIQDSLDAVNGRFGWLENPHMVVDMTPTQEEGPETFIRVDDSNLWETIAEPAANAGVTVTVSLWLPGDPALTVAGGTKTFDHAVLVVHAYYSREV